MRRLLLWNEYGFALLLLLACAALAAGQEVMLERAAYGPTAIPDRIVLTWDSDPRTTQAVTWRTDSSVVRGLAEIAQAEDGPDFASRAGRLEATTTRLDADLGTAHYHSVRFEGLRPSTRYAYRVGAGSNWSEWSQFATASDRPDPFTFVYVGDAQNDLKSHWSRLVREAYRDAPTAAFFLHAGDLVNRANSDREWGEWFYAGSHIHRMTPCIATPGNHEYQSRRLSRHWRPTFAFPENGPAGFDETVYWLDYQGARIISLNSNQRHEEQAEWLEGVLAENPARWTIITFHHPMYSSGEGRDNPHLRRIWQPLFDKYRVDLVLQGHDHTYARSRLMAGENVATGVRAQQPEAGTVYVVSVSGPKMYNLNRQPFMRRVAEDTQLYQIIRIDGDQLHYDARTAVGRRYDGFTLRKRPAMLNELIERVPETPERRRQ